MNNFSLIPSYKLANCYILVFSPMIVSVNRELLKFIETSDFSEKTIIKMDLIAFVGERQERYIQLTVDRNKIVDGSITKGVRDIESENVTLINYSNLSKQLIKKIYPISYRNEVIKLKEGANYKAPS